MSNARESEITLQKAVITMRDLTKVYRSETIEYPALRGIDLTINEGEFVSIMGPSGSGKTTLMNIIGLLDNLTGGYYELQGIDSSDLSDASSAALRNRTIGFIFQSFNLLPQMNLIDNVALPMLYAGIPAKERRERAGEALKHVGLDKWSKHRPTEISGGQQQRVAVARAMVMRPSILLADEPTGNLDSLAAEAVLKLFHELHDIGVTLIIITHDITVAHHADRLIELFDGKISNDSLLTSHEGRKAGIS
ncbi:MAG: ABC transporter ATP-binding protein [Clostridiaceae bacterium]|jgi:putative ABC transport system ATP-binding protein|nr:ABC transporter ATP-binding protein [Clostridiaceae bacterium]